MDANTLAHEIHRRRKLMDANAPRHGAAGIAKFCSDLGHEPTTDDFDPYLNLRFVNDDDSTLGLVTGNSSIWEIKDTRVYDFYVFTKGERLAQTEIVGWLPGARVVSAPQVRGRGLKSGVSYLVDTKCIFPMTQKVDLKAAQFGLEEPDLNVPGVWDYDLQALWTPLGFHIYDHNAAQIVAFTDSEMSR